MGAIGMQVIRVTSVPCPCYRSASGGWEWLLRCNDPSSLVHIACNMRMQHDDVLSKTPLCLIVATTPMDLLHVDFTSIEMTLELNRLPKITNVLVFQDHFTKHVRAYVTPDQTAETVTKFLYQGYISIFWAPARILSDWGATFMSSITDVMCRLLSMNKLWTMLYHPQMNRLVERSHQTIMQMIRKLGEDKKGQLARTSGWNSTHLQWHSICHDGL